MAHTTRPRNLAAGTLPSAAGAAPTSTGALPSAAATGRTGGVDSALDRLWGLLTSMKLGVVLILAFAAFALVGTLLIQMPAGVADDPQARAGWLAEVRPKYGGWTGILDQLQLFTIFQSVWLRAIGALLAASTIACTLHRIPGTWRTMTTVSYTHLTLPTNREV